MNSEEYREWTLSLEWCNMKPRLTADKPKCCFKCRAGGIPLDIHHLFYREHPRMTQPQDIVMLCRDCHDLVEDAKKAKLIPKFHTEAHITGLPYVIKFKATKRPKKKSPGTHSHGINKQELMEKLNGMPPSCRSAVAKCMGVGYKDDMTVYARSKALTRKIIQVFNIISTWSGAPPWKGKASKSKPIEIYTWVTDWRGHRVKR